MLLTSDSTGQPAVVRVLSELSHDAELSGTELAAEWQVSRVSQPMVDPTLT